MSYNHSVGWYEQPVLSGMPEPVPRRATYSPFLALSLNGKGVLDLDTVKGCELGMRAYPDGGCCCLAAGYGCEALRKHQCRVAIGVG